MALKIINIDTPKLGDRSYLIHDGKIALVVDPQRDIDRIDELLVAEGVALGAVADTHIHNDYVSGGLELSRKYGVEYVLGEKDPVNFDHFVVTDNDVVPVGSFAVQALHTPGHTYTHMSFVLLDSNENAQGVFTGGSMLHGSTGRPDLFGAKHSVELAGMQHHSVRRLAESLEDHISIYPTHGFGSLCAATPTSGDSSTIADEKKTNPALLLSKDAYIDQTLAGLDAFPTYYKHMGLANLSGPEPVDLSALNQMSTDEILKALTSDSWVIDLRIRTLFAAEHLKGSFSFGLDGSFATYLGWLYPYEKQLVLISDTDTDVTAAQRELVRIGIDHPIGSYVGLISSFNETASIRVAKFAELLPAMKDSNACVLDVRQINERKKSHIENSIFIPFYEVQSRIEEIPKTGEIWVHCATGYRASTVIGFIERSGRTPVLINEDYAAAAAVNGLSISFGPK